MSDQMADLRVKMTACRVDKESRLDGVDKSLITIDKWQTKQNGELKKIRARMSGILVAIIMLLIGVVSNLLVDRAQPDIRAIVEQVIQSIDRP